jgi:large subunit ribosomal protein L20
MPRAIDGTRRRSRRSKILRHAKGYWGRRSNLFRTAKDAVAKSLANAYRDRRNKKRDFRSLWITRISAAARQNGLTYATLMHGLKEANIQINRKALSNLAIEDPDAFKALVDTVKTKLSGSAVAEQK